MKFGTIGAGTVALAFAREALAIGHEVVLSSRRGPESLAGKVAELGKEASVATVEEAASLDYVLLAVPWRNLEDALQGLPAWQGRVLIDATNPFIETNPKLVLADLGGKGASEVAAGLAPGASARLVTAFVRVGFSGDFGGSWFLTRLAGPAKARELYFTGRPVDAEEALSLGLVNRVVPDDQLQGATMDLALTLAQGPAVALTLMKRNLNHAETGSLSALLDLEAKNQVLTGRTEDHREAAKAFVEKRAPVFVGR